MAKILLVEDDNNLREIYEARLQAEGYEIVSAQDGEEALVVAKKEKPDLIISDVMMPRVSGFEMLDILRNTEGLKDVKVIMLTALGQAEDKSRADSLGADRYLVKSQVTLEDIVRSASDLLGGSSSPAAPVTTAPAAAAIAPAPSTAAPVAAMPIAAPPPAPVMPVAPMPVAQPTLAVPPAPAPVPATPAPTGPTSDRLVADAVNNLISGTARSTTQPQAAQPAPATPPTAPPMVAPPPVAAAPAPTPMPPAPTASPAPMITPAPSAIPRPPLVPQLPTSQTPQYEPNTNDSAPVANKKIIQPMSGGRPTQPDLNELLAKEGINNLDPTPHPQVPPPATHNLPHPPGHVISPNPTNASGQPIDPNSIAL